MCTALSWKGTDAYFGRTLDIDRSYGEEVVVMPRRFWLAFRQGTEWGEHHALIGMATVVDGIPLYYDAVNEHGLAMAGLNFPGNAYYAPPMEGTDNIAPFEFIPWVLGQCRTVAEAEVLLGRLCLADMAFSEHIPPAPLHWMIADSKRSLVVEAMRDGLHVYDNPVGVMANNPPFPQQLENLSRYEHLRVDNAEVVREEGLPYESYCQGLGAVGLPGDVSSMSRFVRLTFGRRHAVAGVDEATSVGQFFRLLNSVAMIRGLCRTDEGSWDITLYSACMNMARGLYYYTTYDNSRISCVDMHRTELDGGVLHRFSPAAKADIRYGN